MVRVNLLPAKKELRRTSTEASPTWLLAVVGAVVFEIVILLFVHTSKTDELAKQRTETAKLKADIDKVKSQLANHAEVRAQLAELRAREEAIQKLQGARTGPTQTLLELGRILTPGRGATADRDRIEQLKRDNPSATPNPSWDSRRLWLTQYSELDRNVNMSGLARDGEDVSELLRRLHVSDYFADVTLMPAKKIVDGKTGLEFVDFQVRAKVKY